MLNCNTLHLTFNISKMNSNEMIKLIGRLHSHLVDIMDLLNCCYSIQVKYFFLYYSFIHSFYSDILHNLYFVHKIMVFLGIAFNNNVGTFYVIFLHFVGHNKYDVMSIIDQLNFDTFWIISVLILIYTANRVSNEVNKYFKI